MEQPLFHHATPIKTTLTASGLPLAASRPHLPAMPFPTMPDPGADRELEEARRHPERDTLELAAAGAARTLGPDHSATRALAGVDHHGEGGLVARAAGGQDAAPRPARGDCRGDGGLT